MRNAETDDPTIIHRNNGVYDPGILKAVFLAGGPGSGKSHVTNQLFGVRPETRWRLSSASGLKVRGSDVIFEHLLEQEGIDPKTLGDMPPAEFERLTVGPNSLRKRASRMTQSLMDRWVVGKLGIIWDGTGDVFEKIQKRRRWLESLGYDTFLVFVDTTLEVAQTRNAARSRSLPRDIVESIWQAVQDNKSRLRAEFGAQNFAVIDNTRYGPLDAAATKATARFVQAPIKNAIGRKWKAQELNERKRNPQSKAQTVYATIQQLARPGLKLWMAERKGQLIGIIETELAAHFAKRKAASGFRMVTGGGEGDANTTANESAAIRALAATVGWEQSGIRTFDHADAGVSIEVTNGAVIIRVLASGRELNRVELAEFSGKVDKLISVLDGRTTMLTGLTDAGIVSTEGHPAPLSMVPTSKPEPKSTDIVSVEKAEHAAGWRLGRIASVPGDRDSAWSYYRLDSVDPEENTLTWTWWDSTGRNPKSQTKDWPDYARTARGWDWYRAADVFPASVTLPPQGARLHDLADGRSHNAVLKRLLKALAPSVKWSVKSSSGGSYSDIGGAGGTLADRTAGAAALRRLRLGWGDRTTADNLDASTQKTYHTVIPDEWVTLATGGKDLGALETKKAQAEVDRKARAVAARALEIPTDSVVPLGTLLVRAWTYSGTRRLEVSEYGYKTSTKRDGTEYEHLTFVVVGAAIPFAGGRVFMPRKGDGVDIDAAGFTPAKVLGGQRIKAQGVPLVHKYLTLAGVPFDPSKPVLREGSHRTWAPLAGSVPWPGPAVSSKGMSVADQAAYYEGTAPDLAGLVDLTGLSKHDAKAVAQLHGWLGKYSTEHLRGRAEQWRVEAENIEKQNSDLRTKRAYGGGTYTANRKNIALRRRIQHLGIYLEMQRGESLHTAPDDGAAQVEVERKARAAKEIQRRKDEADKAYTEGIEYGIKMGIAGDEVGQRSGEMEAGGAWSKLKDHGDERPFPMAVIAEGIAAAKVAAKAHKFPEYSGKPDAYLDAEDARLDEKIHGVGYGPKSVHWVPRSVSDPELIERRYAIKAEQGRHIWQRHPDAAKRVMGIPEHKHKQLVEKARSEGYDVPQDVLDAHGLTAKPAAKPKPVPLTGTEVDPGHIRHMPHAQRQSTAAEYHEVVLDAEARGEVGESIRTLAAARDKLDPGTYAAPKPRSTYNDPEPDVPGQWAQPSEIPWDVAKGAARHTSHVPEKRGRQQQREYASMLNNAYAKWNGKVDAGYLDDLKRDFRAAYIAMLHSKGNTSSWAITGRSGRNSRRESKKMDAADAKTHDVLAVIPAWEKRMKRQAKADATVEAGGEAAELRQKIATRKRGQELMKAANKVIRKKTTSEDEKHGLLVSMGFSDRNARKLVDRAGFESYELTNNNAEIRRLQKRLPDVEAKEVREAQSVVGGFALDTEYAFDADPAPSGGTVEYDFADNRLRLHFEDRVSKRDYPALSGWNFSRLNTAWQRKLTDNAIHAGRDITGLALPWLGDF